MKAPGKRDHQGIGFSGPSSSALPPDEVYQLGMLQQQAEYSQIYHHQQDMPASMPPQPQQHFQPHSPLQQHFKPGLPQQQYYGGGDPGAKSGTELFVIIAVMRKQLRMQANVAVGC